MNALSHAFCGSQPQPTHEVSDPSLGGVIDRAIDFCIIVYHNNW